MPDMAQKSNAELAGPAPASKTELVYVYVFVSCGLSGLAYASKAGRAQPRS